MPLIDFHAAGAGLDRAAEALAGYSESLLREVAGRLIRPRNTWTADEVRDRLLTALADPVHIDRTLRRLTAPARKLLRLIGVSRQPRWRIRGLLDLLAGSGYEDGLAAVRELLDVGLMFPVLLPKAGLLTSFDPWLQHLTNQPLATVTLPMAAARSRGQELALPDLRAEPLPLAAVREADGLEWPLRLAVLWQVVRAGPLRRTQQGGFFKRDVDRLRSQPLLAAPPAEAVGPIPDPDLLTLLLAVEEDVVNPDGDQIMAGTFPDHWSRGIHDAATSLFAVLPGLSLWDPVDGWTDDLAASRWVAPLAVLIVSLLADKGDTWVAVSAIEEWAAKVSEARPGTAEALLLGVLYQLRLVQAARQKTGWHVRLGPLGRALANGAKSLPPDRPAVEQTLLVQPNLEIVVYRQGVTPALIVRLSRIAVWKTLGLACTLQLTAESVYHGLESGETLADLIALFEQHGTRGVSETVIGTLRSWSSKRERVLVFPAALLLEFRTSGDLDRALRQGLVERKLTDRIGLIAAEDRINYGQFRLVGTRDYLAPDELCVEIEDDGLTLIVNDSRSDLLLDSEVRRFAEPLSTDERPRYRMAPGTLQVARRQGLDAPTLDGWFRRRTGGPLPGAARLLLTAEDTPPLELGGVTVVRVPTPEVADGLVSWTETRSLIAERLSPTVLSIAADAVDRLQAKLAEIGVRIVAISLDDAAR
jgi:hypothetical protein